MDKEVSLLHNGIRGTCKIEGCPNDSFAKGMCNTHYIRKRNGSNMEKPVQAIATNGCIECGEALNSKGGWQRCVKHYKQARQKAIKKALVKALGGKCQKCNNEFPLCVYDFHHLEEKSIDPSYAIASRSIEQIAEEISKCILLCANCHRIEHEK